MAKPSRLALALLDRFVPENEPLVGDLLEEYERRPSAWWLWRQVFAAIAVAAFRNPPDTRPLKLLDHDPTMGVVERGRVSRFPRTINLSAGPVYGIGGVGLLTIVVFVTLVAPSVWWTLLVALAGGALIAIAKIILNRHRSRADHRHVLWGPSLRG